MLKIWGRKTSSNVQALMWCVGELGLPYERVDIGHRFGGNDTPDFLSMNPNGTVPVLQDGGGAPLWETGAIMRYLCNRYAGEPFWPAKLEERTNVDIWAEWSKINVAMGFTVPIFWRIVRTPADQQDQGAISAALTALGEKFDIAEERLAKQPYLASNAFTLADIQFGHVLYRYYDIAIDRPKHPAVRRYYERLTERPAFREHVMISYEELRVS